MKKRLMKKKENKIKMWVIVKYSNGKYNSLGINEEGKVPFKARPLKGDFETLEEAVSLFNTGVHLPVVELTEEEEFKIGIVGTLQTDEGEVVYEDLGLWGEKYIWKRIVEGNCYWVRKENRSGKITVFQ